MFSGPPTQSEVVQQYQRDINQTLQPAISGTGSVPAQNILIEGPKAIPKYQQIMIERFRAKMALRGNGSLIGLARSFKIMDDNGSGTLDQYEFTKAINDLGLDINPKDIDGLFKSFDVNNDGVINFNEFVRVVKGPLSQFRQQIVLRAFKTLDFNGDGILTIDDLRQKYNASMHPDVKSGKRTEDEVLTEFIETFELHHNILNGTRSDGSITPDEFLEYYSHVSSNIESDAYFELLMSNAWNLESRNNPNSMPFAGSNKKVTKVNAREAYRNDHHRNLFGTDNNTPFDK